MRALLASLLILVSTGTAGADPASVSSAPIASFARLSSGETFGPFTWRGGLTITSDDPRFGGLSGLVMGKDCESLLAVSDKGHWFDAKLRYEDDRLAGVGQAEIAAMLDSAGGPLHGKQMSDAEALTRLSDGRMLVAFERALRFGRYDVLRDGFKARYRLVPHPKDMDDGEGNAQIEAAGELADGRLLAISEGQFDSAGNIRAWAWKEWRTTLFRLTRYGDYRVTDLAVLPDGSVLTLERRFTASSLPGMAIRRFPSSAIAMDAVITPELLLEATTPSHIIDNMEGIALCTRSGETRVTLISDDNFDRNIQSTILLQFAYRP